MTSVHYTHRSLDGLHLPWLRHLCGSMLCGRCGSIMSSSEASCSIDCNSWFYDAENCCLMSCKHACVVQVTNRDELLNSLDDIATAFDMRVRPYSATSGPCPTLSPMLMHSSPSTDVLRPHALKLDQWANMKQSTPCMGLTCWHDPLTFQSGLACRHMSPH